MLDPKANLERSRKSSHLHAHSKSGQTACKELSRSIRLLTSLFPNGIFSNSPPRLRIEPAGCGLIVEDPAAAPGEPTAKGVAEHQLRQVTLKEEDLARSADEILTILLHQMVHVADYARGVEDLYPGGFHNLQFRMSAQEVGFLVTQSEPRRGTDQVSPGAELLSLFRDIRMAPSVLSPFRHAIRASDRPWTCHWGPPPMNRSVPIQQMRIQLPDGAPAPPWPVIQKKTGKVHSYGKTRSCSLASGSPASGYAR